MAIKIEEATKQLKPQEYQKLLRKVILNSISLVEIKTKFEKELLPNDSVLSVSVTDSYDMNLKSNPIYSCATLKIIASPGKIKKSKSFLQIDAKYYISFNTDEDIPEVFWTIYQKFTLPNQIWPYFRELVQNITTRMNIPSLTLPIRIR